MEKYELTEYADILLKRALHRVHNLSDAEDIVQETLMAALAAIEKEQPILDAKKWLYTALDRRYYDMIRRKYRKPTVCIDVISETAQDDQLYERLENSEDAENIRRCLAYLTKLYREIMVRFYMNGESVSKIAVSLGIPESTVKTRLYTGRKNIRKEFTMENYTRQSYEPETLWLACSGKSGMNEEPFSLVGRDKIKMNLLILAYNKPITVPELAKAIGISTTYIEPIIDEFIKSELMKRISDKVYSDFIIYTEEDRTASLTLEEKLAEKLYGDMWEIADKGLNELRSKTFYKKLSPSQKLKLESFFAVETVQNAVHNIRNEVCGGVADFNDYPDRPNDGKWYAMGNKYPPDYLRDKKSYINYYISGEIVTELNDYHGIKKLTLCEYDCILGASYQGYSGNSCAILNPMSATDVMKMLYAVYSDNNDELPLINTNCFKNIDGFIKMGFLTRDSDDKISVDVPIMEMSDRWELYRLSEEYDNIISEKYRSEFMQLMQSPVNLPPHLKSVPNWQRYMNCCSTFPMRVIMNAHENGLFLADRDLKKNPVPAVFLAIEK